MGANQVRIIGGRWRGRKLVFPAVAGLRPTSDRIRETLFNWLMPCLSGSSCLDLFAGSGALGFEAASRGAARVVMVESDAAIMRALQENRQRLAAGQVELVQQQAAGFLSVAGDPFDVVFLDPPFVASELLVQAIGALTEGGWLREGARIYVETPAKGSLPPIPESWTQQKQKKAGQVTYRLFNYRVSP